MDYNEFFEYLTNYSPSLTTKISIINKNTERNYQLDDMEYPDDKIFFRKKTTLKKSLYDKRLEKIYPPIFDTTKTVRLITMLMDISETYYVKKNLELTNLPEEYKLSLVKYYMYTPKTDIFLPNYLNIKGLNVYAKSIFQVFISYPIFDYVFFKILETKPVKVYDILDNYMSIKLSTYLQLYNVTNIIFLSDEKGSTSLFTKILLSKSKYIKNIDIFFKKNLLKYKLNLLLVLIKHKILPSKISTQIPKHTIKTNKEKFLNFILNIPVFYYDNIKISKQKTTKLIAKYYRIFSYNITYLTDLVRRFGYMVKLDLRTFSIFIKEIPRPLWTVERMIVNTKIITLDYDYNKNNQFLYSYSVKKKDKQ